MTRKDILRAYLEDEILVENGHLKEGEFEKIKWTDIKNDKLIEVIKLAIEGVVANDTSGVITGRVNRFLNQ
jgi:hypothetical protein